MKTPPKTDRPAWKTKLHEIIFEADTPMGKLFDVILIAAILISVLIVMLDSVKIFHQQYALWLRRIEWGFTILFTIEYLLRLLSVGKPLRYTGSFFGIIDLMAVLPTYLSVLLPGSQYLLVIRVFRILRVFRVLKLVKYLSEATILKQAIYASHRKILVFLYTVVIMVIILGSLIYLIEGEENGFTSIPRSIYWAIVTLTTVGYGDIAPTTSIGQTLAALVMILGYGIIAVPTGIVSSELSKSAQRPVQQKISTQACPECSAEGHDPDAVYCKYCSAQL